MKRLAERLDNIVREFIVENVPKEIREEFVIAAIHFNVNLNACSKYDLMRIDHKAKELVASKENKILTTAAVYSYILYKSLNSVEVDEEEKLDIKVALMKISTYITDYLTYRIDKEELDKSLYNELTVLGI